LFYAYYSYKKERVDMTVVELDRQNRPEKQNKQQDMYLAKDCKIEGNLKSSGNIIIDGEIVGTIDTKGDFIVGRQGKVNAEIKAENVYVQGEIRGNLSVANLLEITSTGVIYGDINTKLLKIEKGGRFYGKSLCNEEDSEQDKTDSQELAYTPIVYNRLPDSKLSLEDYESE